MSMLTSILGRTPCQMVES